MEVNRKRQREFDAARYGLMKRSRSCTSSDNSRLESSRNQQSPKPSAFVNVLHKVTKEYILSMLSVEARRLLNRRRGNSHLQSLSLSSSFAALSTRSSLTSLTAEYPDGSFAMGTAVAPAVSTCRDVPMLTLSQVGLVCERMIKEREDQLREEYDQVLAEGLNERYTSFLMFNHDQLALRPGEVPSSYLS